jgi:ATP-dependent RNA helicase RhlE|tara:strand:- start:206 stop:1468 length:1263 start_codon:yes stop_codon:yes gene_type:complete
MTFKDLGLIEPILKAVTEKGYTSPTPIQEQSIPILLKKKDLLGCAQTGTGKTAAFTIPILQHLATAKQTSQKRQIKSLIVTPTRELALQIEENIKEYGKYTSIKSTVIFGGVNQNPQVNRLRQGIDILVATPGRLLDLINQGFISLSHIEYFVLDEADQMLDMGFIHDIKKIIAKLPKERQSLFFSATMAKPIVDLSNQILGFPEKVTIKPEQTTADKVGQSLYMVSNEDKIKLLVDIIEERNAKSVLVFSRTKHGANKVVKLLDREEINSAAIHGNKTQAARVKALNGFKDGSIKVLVATDIAARGIDVSELELVVNYDLPNIPETYVHRIGRTGRAKASGEAISFCSAEERSWLRAIQKLIRTDIPLIKDQPYHDTSPEEAPPKQGGGGGRRQGGGGGNRKPNSGGGNKPQRSSKPRR